MDEAKSHPGQPGDRSQAAAEKLRALRERANQALDDHRRSLGDIESDLSQRVRQLAEEFSPAAGAQQPPAPADHEMEVAALRQQLDEGRVKHEKFVEQLAVARRQLEALQSTPASCPQCEQGALELDATRDEIAQLREQLALADHEREEHRARLEKFVEQLTAARQAINELEGDADERVERLTAEKSAAQAERTAALLELANARGELGDSQTANASLDKQVAALGRDLAALHSEYETVELRTEEIRRELESAKIEAATLREKLTAADERSRASSAVIEAAAGEAERLQSQILALEVQRTADEVALSALREQSQSDAGGLRAAASERDSLLKQCSELQRAKNVLEEALANEQAAAEAERERIPQQAAFAETEAADLRRRLATAETDGEGLRTELATARQELATAQNDLQRRSTTADTEGGKLRLDLAAARQELAAAHSEKQAIKKAEAEEAESTRRLQSDLEAARAEIASLAEQQTQEATKLEEARSQLNGALRAVEQEAHETVDLRKSLEAARIELAAVAESSCPRSERDEIERRFDLALADMQKLKRDNSELREELSRRPEVSDQESPDLLSIRAERDELAVRVAELQTAAATAAEVGGQQEQGDLQRRFEMAVDDVRQLKQENAQLRDRLASAKSPTTGDAGGGALDWASQKARLLATLEAEDGAGPLDAKRKAERATVEGTISLTDRVVAEKDREITELRAALEGSRGDTAKADQRGDAQERGVLDADSLIVAERARLAKLQTDWETKIRAAELEFALERAKFAREQAGLREKLLDLDAAPAPKAAPAGSESRPRRRWLAALGLGDEGDETPQENK